MSGDLFDPVASSPYVRRFERDVRAARWAPCAPAEVLQAASRNPLVLIGEFHALPSAARTAAFLLRHLRETGHEPVLGLEMIHARDQRSLDSFLAGGLSRAAFHRRIRYREEWGYPWKAAGELLALARELRVPVHGLDTPPRGGVEDLAFRDRMTARRLAALLAKGRRRTRVVVLFGEAHLAGGHLPAQVARLIPGLPAPLRVFHDLPLTGGWQAGWLRGPDCFLSQEVSPGKKSRALSRVIDGWVREAPDPGWIDFPLVVHGLIQALAERARIDLRRSEIAPGRWLVDEIPRVTGPGQAGTARQILREEGVAPGRFFRAAELQGAVFSPQANLLHLARPGLGPALVGAALFLLSALAGRLYSTDREDPAREVQRQVRAAAWARLADPRLDLAPFPEGAEGARLAEAWRRRALSQAGLRRALFGPFRAA